MASKQVRHPVHKKMNFKFIFAKYSEYGALRDKKKYKDIRDFKYYGVISLKKLLRQFT